MPAWTVTDPIDGNLSNNPDDPVVVTRYRLPPGAEQRFS